MESQTLQSILNREIEIRGYISTDELESILKNIINPHTGEHYKLSNAERRLRPSDSPNVEAVKNDKGFIKGYKWKKPKKEDIWSKKHFINIERARQASLI